MNNNHRINFCFLAYFDSISSVDMQVIKIEIPREGNEKVKLSVMWVACVAQVTD